MLPEGLEERYRALRRRPKLRAELKAEREAAVTRTERGNRTDLWVPRPPLDLDAHQPPGRLSADGEVVAGLDREGQPVLVRWHAAATVLRLLTWDERHVEIVGFLTSDRVSHVTWVDLDDGGRPSRFATAGVEFNDLGKGAEVVECEWEGDRCTRQRMLIESETGQRYAYVAEAEYDDAGLARVRRTSADGEPAGGWDRERHGWEDHPLPPVAAVEAYVAAVGRAVAEALAASPVRDPFCLRVSVMRGYAVLHAGSAAYRDAARRRAGSPLDVLRGIDDPIWLEDRLDAAGRRALRSLSQLGHEQRPPQEAWWSACVTLVRDLDRPWPGRTEPFLPYVGGDELPYRGDDEPGSVTLAREALGDERADAFLASLRPPAGTRRPARLRRPPDTRDELRRILRDRDLPERIAEHAAWGLALVGGGTGESRLGARPDLPAGEPWPTCEGRALTHLLTLDLAEVPDLEGRELLPADGTLVFLADLTEDGELWEPRAVGDNPSVMLRHLAAGTDVHQPEPPPGTPHEYDPPVVLRRRRVRFEPVLTLPEVLEGLTADERLGYEELYWQLVELTPGLREPAHLLLGHPVPTQEDPREPGEVALLHIGPDGALGFEYLDGGDLTVHGAEDDVRAGRWDRLTVSANSS